MSEELEDSDVEQVVEERQGAYNALFGEEDEDEEHGNQEEQLEGADVGAQPDAGQARSRKEQLQRLAGLAKKRKAAEEGEADGGKRRKKKQRDEEGKDGGKPARKKSEGKARPQRKRNDDEGGGKPADHVAAGEPEDDVASEELQENDVDKGFIDDEGVEPASGGEDDEAHINAAEEAEEEGADGMDEIDRMLAKKKKKKEVDHRQSEGEVLKTIAKMEAAFEDDWETVCYNLGTILEKGSDGALKRDSDGMYKVAVKGAPPANKRPAVSKLKMLQEMEHFLAQRKYHELFLASGGLGVLKSWLEPYEDGSLPNVRVRTSVLKCLQTLPIDTRMEDVKETLKRSQLGKNVMFLFKCMDETPENRRLAKELVHKWSRPIFYDQDAEDAKKRQQEQRLAEQRRQSVMQRQLAEQSKEALEASRQKAVRIHALIPQGSKLDYVVNPENARDISAASEVVQARSGHKDDNLAKKLREQQRKLKASSARAMKPSVEGRNIVLMH